ncbi:MAG TPA: hypothetical protein VME40_19445 [Caulobacteraceae bacterium]|nr:hypothetical protein [Caulobacteraceae bacterium]
MTAQIVPIAAPAPSGDDGALRAAVTELHALMTLDPILGAQAARAYFVLNPIAKARIAAAIDPSGRGHRRSPAAYALVAYDFPFALLQLQATASQLSPDRAKAVVSRSAGLQGQALQAAAAASSLSALPAPAFDAVALKSAFFPSTQETVIQLFRLELDRP